MPCTGAGRVVWRAAMRLMLRLSFAAFLGSIGCCGSGLAEVDVKNDTSNTVRAAKLDSAKPDTVRLAIGQKGVWDSLVTVLGVDQGLFKAENIEVEILWT